MIVEIEGLEGLEGHAIVTNPGTYIKRTYAHPHGELRAHWTLLRAQVLPVRNALLKMLADWNTRQITVTYARGTVYTGLARVTKIDFCTRQDGYDDCGVTLLVAGKLVRRQKRKTR